MNRKRTLAAKCVQIMPKITFYILNNNNKITLKTKEN